MCDVAFRTWAHVAVRSASVFVIIEVIFSIALTILYLIAAALVSARFAHICNILPPGKSCEAQLASRNKCVSAHTLHDNSSDVD